MNDAALEREIERALAVDPSPEFLVRVRARIADEPAPASRGFGWLFAGVATAATAAVLVLAVLMGSPARPPAKAPLLASRSIGSAVVVPSVSPAIAGPAEAGHYVPKGVRRDDQSQYVVSGFSRTQRESTGFSRTQRESTGVSRTQRESPGFSRTAATRSPAPLFDAHETTALQRLIADVRDARVDLAPLLKEGPMPLPSNKDLVIPPIVIEPLETGGIQGERP
jgi:hypothetical protein